MDDDLTVCRTYADTMSRILIVEDDNDIAALIAHYLEKAGYGSEIVPDGGAGADRGEGNAARSRHPRFDAAGAERPRGVQGAARRQPHGGAAHHHADRARRRVGAHPRARFGRRRLRRQAVQSERADGARARAAAPRRAAGDQGAHPALRPDQRRRRTPHRVRQRRERAADGEGISAAAISARASRPRAVARSAAVRRLGLSVPGRHAHRRRARAGACARSCRFSKRRSSPCSSSATSSPNRRRWSTSSSYLVVAARGRARRLPARQRSSRTAACASARRARRGEIGAADAPA